MNPAPPFPACRRRRRCYSPWLLVPAPKPTRVSATLPASPTGAARIAVATDHWSLQSGDVFLLCTDGLWE